jgi:hypothetical protein
MTATGKKWRALRTAEQTFYNGAAEELRPSSR